MKFSLHAILALALTLLLGTTFAHEAIAQDLAGTSSAVPPFTLSYTANPVPGSSAELVLRSVRLSGVNPASETWFAGCEGCQTAGHLSKWRHLTGNRWVSTARGRIVMGSQSSLLAAVTSPGQVGRFKVYSVRPPASLLAIKSEGCISPDQQTISPAFPTHLSQINQVPCSGLLLPAQGTAVLRSDAITVTFRTPKRLAPGVSWVLAAESAGGQTGCVKFDAAFLPGGGPIGSLLTATLLPSDSLAIPSPLPYWCAGKFTIAAFTSAGHGKNVHSISERIGDFTVS